MIPLMVALGAAVGAPSRYVVDRWVRTAWSADGLPVGTLVINLVGSAVLGLVLGLGTAGLGSVDGAVLAAVGTGWCGAFTTYSTFSYEAVQLAREGRWSWGTAYVAGSVVGGLALAFAGMRLGAAMG